MQRIKIQIINKSNKIQIISILRKNLNQYTSSLFKNKKKLYTKKSLSVLEYKRRIKKFYKKEKVKKGITPDGIKYMIFEISKNSNVSDPISIDRTFRKLKKDFLKIFKQNKRSINYYSHMGLSIEIQNGTKWEKNKRENRKQWFSTRSEYIDPDRQLDRQLEILKHLISTMHDMNAKSHSIFDEQSKKTIKKFLIKFYKE